MAGIKMITAVDDFKLCIRVPGRQQIADLIRRCDVILAAGYHQFQTAQNVNIFKLDESDRRRNHHHGFD